MSGRGVGLSAREHQVLQRIAQGKGTKEIARDLGISSATVRSHVIRIFSKQDVTSRMEAVMKALRDGLLDIRTVFLPGEPGEPPHKASHG